MEPTRPPRSELPVWLWLWLPLVPVALIVGTYYLAPDLHKDWFFYKEGPLEWGTAIVLVPGVVAGFLAMRRMSALPSPYLRTWLVMVTLGAIYYAGEEISWGQQIWHWDTPEALQEINRQEETNLHNMSGWFNEKPKLLLELWVFLGIVMALRQRFGAPEKRWPADDPRRWFWATRALLPTSVLTILIYLPKRIEKAVGDFESGTLLADLRLSEPQEFYFALFLMLYLLSVHSRLRAVPARVDS